MEIFELFGGIGFILFILCLFSDEILVFAIMVIVLGIIGYLIFLLICYWMRKDIEKEERKKWKNIKTDIDLKHIQFRE